jgi:hypothetical protein
MLRPSKHSHPDRTVINVALVLLARLKTRRLDEYDDLLKYARHAVSGGDVLFLPSLNFLFLNRIAIGFPIDNVPVVPWPEHAG